MTDRNPARKDRSRTHCGTKVGVASLAVVTGLLVGCAGWPPTTIDDAPRLDTPEAVGLSSEALARLDRVLDSFVDEGQIPGYQLLIARDGRVVHERLRGSMDLEGGRPLREDTIYRLYSMSKVITGVAVMIAYERGRFLLNDPISKWLPALADMQVMEWDEAGNTRLVPAEREITILDLLRHTSGFSYHFIAPRPLGGLYMENTITPGLRPLPVASSLGNAGTDQDATLDDMVDRLGRLPLVLQPGSGWHYGVNMDVLGRLIEVSSGQTFPEFLAEHVFEPLGMQDAGFYVPAEKVDRFASLYGPTSDAGMQLLDPPRSSAYLEQPTMPGGGGGMVATADDYMRFALMLLGGGELDGERLLGPHTVDLMMANHLASADFGDRPLRFTTGSTYANEGLGMGFGLTGSVVTQPALTGLPVSAGTFGWGGAASTFFWVDPQEGIAVVFMTQLIPSNTYPLRGHLMKGVNAAIID